MMENPILQGPRKGEQDRTWLSDSYVLDENSKPIDASGDNVAARPAANLRQPSLAEGKAGVTGEEPFESVRRSIPHNGLHQLCQSCFVAFPEAMLTEQLVTDNDGTIEFKLLCPDHVKVN